MACVLMTCYHCSLSKSCFWTARYCRMFLCFPGFSLGSRCFSKQLVVILLVENDTEKPRSVWQICSPGKQHCFWEHSADRAREYAHACALPLYLALCVPENSDCVPLPLFQSSTQFILVFSHSIIVTPFSGIEKSGSFIYSVSLLLCAQSAISAVPPDPLPCVDIPLRL